MHRPDQLTNEFRRVRTDHNAPPARHDHQRRHRAPVNAATLPSDVITPCMREVERIVTRLANAQDAMPNNPILGELAGGRGRSSVLRALRRLEIAQLITVERNGNRRRVRVHATDKATAWGEARPGHSPYMHCKPGEVRSGPAVRTRKPRQPESRPLAAQLPAKPILAMLQLVPEMPRRRREPEPCNFPLWADGERPGRVTRPGMYCATLTDTRGGLCTEHAALCFIPKKTRATAAQRREAA